MADTAAGSATASSPGDAAAASSSIPAAEPLTEENAGKTRYMPHIPGYTFEYLDHTADIQIHSWGETLAVSFEQAVMGMFGYITELESVNINKDCEVEFEVEGHDMDTLLYALMDEFLFRFCADEFMVCKQVKILEMKTEGEEYKIKVKGMGETFDLEKHPQGTEIKAITYSNMQIHVDAAAHDVYVIVDI